LTTALASSAGESLAAPTLLDAATPSDVACQGLVAEGKRDEAVSACQSAWIAEHSPLAGNALVRARLLGPTPPSITDLSAALLVAESVRSKFPTSPWGYAALCEVAEKTGDDVMLQQCSNDLQRLAPDHPETARARAAARSLQPSPAVWVAWLAILAAAVAAAGDGLLRMARRLRASRTRMAAAVALALSAGTSFSLEARAADQPAQISKIPVNDQDPASAVPTPAERNANPVEFGYWLMDVAERANVAVRRGNHQAAIRYFQALAKAVPDKPISYQRLCSEYEVVGEWDNAIGSCRTALNFTPVTVDDYTHYLRLIVTRPGKPTDSDVAGAADVIKHLREDPAGKDVADDWECRLGVRIANADLLETCTGALAAKQPDEPRTIYYQWNLALLRDHFDDAHQLSARAKTTALPVELIAELDQQMAVREAARARTRWYRYGAVLLGIIALLAFVVWLRMPGDKRTAPPPPPSEEPPPAEPPQPAPVAGA
jgi:hypothetical protein